MSTLFVMALIFAGLGPGEAPEYEPAGDSALIIDLKLDGYRNGHMPDDRLMQIGKCKLERDAAYTFSMMVEAAKRDGVDLYAHSCYRPFAVQQRSYERRCPVTETPTYSTTSSGGKVQTGVQKERVCSLPTAPGGLSNHGWGRAADFGDRYGLLTCYDREFLWLQKNAYRFGWVHPRWAQCRQRLEEAWHWEYAGVTIPQLVKPLRFNPAVISQIS